MVRLTRYLFISLFLVSVSACGYRSLEILRHTDFHGSAFQTALAQEYLRFADSEALQYDWADSQYFAEKGLLLAYGETMPPEELSRWKLPRTELPTMIQARQLIMEILTEEAMQNHPTLAAKMQFLFDCWVEQQEEDWQDNDIRQCREGFYVALDQLASMNNPKQAMAPQPKKPITEINEPDDSPLRITHPYETLPAEETTAPTPITSPDSANPPIDATTETTSYMVFFDFNSAKISTQNKQLLSNIIMDMENPAEYEVVLHGHADRAGPENYNLALSKKRAESVKKILLRGGVQSDNISLYAFGESDPRILTADNVREAGNRRVEIFIEE